MTKAEIILAAVNSGATDEELTILDGTPEDQFGEKKKSEEGKTNGSTTNVANVGPRRTATDGDYAYGDGLSDSLDLMNPLVVDPTLSVTDTWVDDNGNTINFASPEVKITGKKDEEVKKPGLLEKIGNINIFKGKTLNDFFPKEKDEEEEIEEEIEEVKIKLPTSETDATTVGGGTSSNIFTGSVKSGEIIQPEIIEENPGTSYYYDEESGEVKENIPTTIDELLEDKPFTFTFDGEKIYLDKPVEEEEEEEPELATTILGDVITGIGKIYNLGKSVYEDKDERDQLLDNVEKRYYDINNNLAIGMQSIYIDGLKLLEESMGDKAGVTALDDMFGDYGEAVWFTTEGKIVPLSDRTLTKEESYAQGHVLIYKDSGIKVGDPYKQYVVKQYEYILEVEALKNNPELSISEGYKESDAAMFFGGVFNAITSLAETMGPAIATKGMSLIPQITAPFYIDAAREKAKRLYPDLSEKDAIEKLVMSGDEDVLLPNLLGLAAGQLEKIGFKGIIKAMRMNPATFTQGVTSIILAGQREGITEWSQTGLEIYNKSLAAGKEKAAYLAWAAMTGPQGLEAYLQGVVGGTGVSTGGSLISRAFRTNREDIRKINNNIRKQSELKGKLNFFNNNKSESNRKLRDHYVSEIAKLNADLVDIFNNSNKLSKYLTKEEQEFIGFLLESYDNKTREHDSEQYEAYKGVFEFADSNGISVEQALKENYPQLDAQWQELKEVLEKEAVDIVSQIDAIRKRANERMIDDGIKKADKRGIMRTVFETKDDVSNWLNDPANQELFEKQAKEDGITVTELKNQYKNANGWELDGEVFVNKPKAIETGAVSVTEHEIAHFLFGKSIRDKNGDITKEGQELIVKFKKAIGPKVEAIILGRLKANGYKIDGPNANPNAQEEFLTFYLDGVREGEWKENKAALKLLGKEVTSLLKDSGYTNIKFKTAQDIMDWFTSYIEDKDSGKSKVERTPPSKTVSLSSFSRTDLEGPIIELGSVSQDVWDKRGSDNAITYIFGKLDGLIKSKITSEMEQLPDFSEEDFVQRTYMELIPHIRNFVPAQYNEDGSRKLDGNGNLIGNDNLWAWITNQLKNKSLEALKSDDVTKPQFEESVQDEGSFINDIESDEYVDLELSIEEDVTYSGLRNILGIKRGDKLHKKIIEGIKKIIPLEIKNLDTPAFKKALKKYFNDYLFDDIKKILGGIPTKDGYKNFITNNAEALYNLFPQSVFNKSFGDFVIELESNIPPTRVDELVKEGKLPKEMSGAKKRLSGPSLFGKLPWNEDTKQKWIDNFLNPPKGRPASKQNSLIELISYTLGIDATMEVINSDEFKGKYDIPGVVIATIGMKIDRGANVRFNKTAGGEGDLNANNFDENQARKMVKYIETEVGFDEIGPGDVADLLKANFPTAAEDVIALIEKMADLGYIKDQNGTMYLQGIMLSEVIVEADRNQVKEDTLEDKQDKLNKAASILAPRLGPEVMNLLGFDIFGYINRMMDAAFKKKNPEYKYDKTQPQYREDDAGNLISGPFYKALEALKLNVKNSEVKLPEGLNLDDVRLMNKKFPLFKKIEKILNDGDSKIDGSNIAWKKAEILKLEGEITAAGEANIRLAKFIASEIIKADEIDVVTAIHLLQIQTNAVSGFRALTTLDLITILEGSQKADENHPYYEAELAMAKKAKNKSGELKYPTEELAIEAAIKALGTKGEHAAANANTMLKIAILKAKYMKNKNIDVDLELTKIFQGHGQIHGTKGTFNLLDKFGTTNIADWLRLMLDPRRKDMFSPDGKTAEEVVVVKTAPTTRFSKSEMIKNIKLKNLNKVPTMGASVFDFDGTLEEGGKNMIIATNPETGEIVPVSSHDFHGKVDDLIKRGFEFNFDDFVNVKESKKGPMFQKLLNQIKKYGVDNIHILTARQPGAALAIQMWLKQNGVSLLPENITGLGVLGPNGKPIVVTGKNKADWIEDNLILKGFNDIYFVDDGKAIVDEVDKMFNTYPKGLLVEGGKSVLVEGSKASTKRKVIFMTGGPGSSKSTVINKLKLDNYTILNPDAIMEPLLKAAGLPLNQSLLETKEQRSAWAVIQQRAIKEFKNQIIEARNAGKGIVIDGTGASAKVMQTYYDLFNIAGYNMGVINVQTSLETALERNAGRDRVLRESIVIDTWNKVQANISLYKTIFGDNYFEIETDDMLIDDILPPDFVKDIDSFTLKSPVKLDKSGTRFSISDQFNQMLEENEDVGKEKVYSAAKGKIEGRSKKNFWNLIFPPSAYDFELFLYRIIGKGKKGEEDLDFFKKHLLDPYDAAYKAMQDDAQRVTDTFKDLVKKLPEVKKNLKNTIPGTKFTYEQALRVSIWNDMELEVPGLSKTDLKKLLKAIESDPSLIEYKEGLKNVLADGYPPPTDYWTVEGVAYDMDRSINAISRAKHLEVWKKNKEEIFSKENRAKLEAIYGERYVESLDNMLYRMEFGGNKKKVSRIESNWNKWVNNSVGAIMFFNFRSATLQTISALNFVDWENNTPYKAAKQFADIVRYRKNFVKILFSAYLKQRRSGGKRTVNEAELTAYLKGKENPLKAALAWLLEKGFTPTAAADALAIAVGGATYLANQEDFYIAQGMPKIQAEAQAWIDFQNRAEKGQQSSRPDLLSEQQAGGLGRLILAFKNTQQQYFRIMTKATLDIKNKRGSLKGNLSKIAYYGVLQNALFASLQTALFAAFGDDEEWDKKTDRMAQTMIDSILAGLGLTGAVVITVKNGILEYVKQKERGFNADHTRTILQFANLSPTIGSKLRKLYSAIRTEQLNQDAIDKMGLDINSPAVNSIASLISAATNIPVDRAVTITQNLILASTDEANFNQSLALILGWSSWDIGMEPISRKVQQEAKEERKKLMEKLKLMEKEKENLAKQKALKDKGFCAGAKKDGKDCSLPVVKGTSFCTVHAKVKERKDGKKVRCEKIKKGGKQCGTMTSAKSGLCYYHD